MLGSVEWEELNLQEKLCHSYCTRNSYYFHIFINFCLQVNKSNVYISEFFKTGNEVRGGLQGAGMTNTKPTLFEEHM